MTNQEVIFKILGNRPIAFNPILAKITGSVTAGLFLSQLLYWSDKSKNEFFYKTIAEIEEETALTREQQDSAIKRLKQLRLIEVKLMGVPARRHFKLSLSEIHKLVCDKYTNKLDENTQTITDTTTEITTDTKDNSQKENKSEEFNNFLEEFNRLFQKNYRHTDDREKRYISRRKTYSTEEILQALENLSKSDFHKGKNDRGWCADPDFLLRNDSMIDKWINTLQNGHMAAERKKQFENEDLAKYEKYN